MSRSFRAAAVPLAIALCLAGNPGAGAALAGHAQGGSVDARNLGTRPMERVVVRWRSGHASIAAGDRTAHLSAALPGLRKAADVGDDTTAYWLPVARTGTAAMAELHALAAVGGVAQVAPDVRVTADLIPNDTYYASYQSDLFGTYGIDAPAAWDITTGSGSVTVAVIDTGITTHSELAPRVLPGYDFISDPETANDGDGRDADASDPGDWVTAAEQTPDCPAEDSSWHGTHVAGTIGAAGNNGAGVAGIAWSTSILPVRVLGKCGGYLSDIDSAIRWAAGGSVPGVPPNAHPARVLNLSLGGPGSCDPVTQSAIDDATALGAVVVVAAGNSGADLAGFSPASCSGVIVVTATTSAGQRASFSNDGSGATIAAPGVSIASTWNSGTTTPGGEAYAQMSGTSMATPHVSGVAALALAVDPALTPTQVRSLIVDHARAFAPDGSPTGCQTVGCGAGIVDAAAVVEAAASVTPPADTTPPSVASFAPTTGSPFGGTTVQFSLQFSEPVTGLAAGDFAVAGTAGGCSVGAPSGSSASYAVSVSGCSAGTVALRLNAGTVRDGAGNPGPTTALTTAAITIDRTGPVTTGPVTTLRTGARVNRSALPIRLTWSGTDTGGAGVASYQVARSTDGGSTWATIATGLTLPSISTTVTASGTVRFEVRAIDRAGNSGVWTAGPALHPRLRQQGSHTVHYRGPWRMARAAAYSGGSVKDAKARGARATTTFTGRSIALVTTRAPKRGKVRIYVNGTRVATIDLRRSSRLTRSVVWQRTWATSATRTIRIVVVGTAGRPRVDLDAFAILR